MLEWLNIKIYIHFNESHINQCDSVHFGFFFLLIHVSVSFQCMQNHRFRCYVHGLQLIQRMVAERKNCGFYISDNCCLINFSSISIELKPYNRKNNDLPEYGEVVCIFKLTSKKKIRRIHSVALCVLGIIWIYVGWTIVSDHKTQFNISIAIFIFRLHLCRCWSE